jgi:6-phosphogluconate dehydrogenase
MATPTADIGLIGLAVMGENIVLNMESHGFTVAVYNRTTSKVDAFVNGRGKGKKFVGAHSPQEFIAAIKRPRKVMMLVKAGAPVDETIAHGAPYLEKGDILIDGGNTHFPDTTRRMKELAAKGIRYIGTGVSGGEEGALKGPSIMPGGDPTAWPEIKPISRPSPPRPKIQRGARCPVATGLDPRARAISSRWYTTALNTAICSSSANRITS